MSKTLIIYLGIILGITGGCINSSRSGFNSMNSDFKKWKSEFPDSLTDHFPCDIGKDLITCNSSFRNTPKDMLYLTLSKKISEDEKNLIHHYICAPDSCNINIYLNRNTYGFDKKGLGECESFTPVPEYGLFSTESAKPEDLKYYIIETSHESFVNHELYLRFYLPNEWKNGMSRGVGISDKEGIIYYWLIMW